jgi:hypothetical protein
MPDTHKTIILLGGTGAEVETVQPLGEVRRAPVVEPDGRGGGSTS